MFNRICLKFQAAHMTIFKDDFSFTIGCLLLTVSIYKATVSLAYSIQDPEKIRRKENIVVFLCTLLTVICSVSYFLQVLHYARFDRLEKSSLLCKFSSTSYKVALVISKCFCNLVFANRCRTINRKCSALAKRAYCYSVWIIVISVCQLVFDFFYFMFATVPSQKNCLYLEINFNKHSIHVAVMIICFMFATVMQTVILVEIIKPIYRHVNNSSSIQSRNLRSTLYRVVACSLIFSLSDFGFLIGQFFTVKIIKRPMPVVLLINLSLNCICLMCSYKNYKKRFLPFLNFTKKQQNNNKTRQKTNTSSAPSYIVKYRRLPSQYKYEPCDKFEVHYVQLHGKNALKRSNTF